MQSGAACIFLLISRIRLLAGMRARGAACPCILLLIPLPLPVGDDDPERCALYFSVNSRNGIASAANPKFAS